jgi:hypothetical protein
MNQDVKDGNTPPFERPRMSGFGMFYGGWGTSGYGMGLFGLGWTGASELR